MNFEHLALSGVTLIFKINYKCSVIPPNIHLLKRIYFNFNFFCAVNNPL